MHARILLASAAVAFLALPASAIDNSTYDVTRLHEIEIVEGGQVVLERATVTGAVVQTGSSTFAFVGAPDAISFGMKRKGATRTWKALLPADLDGFAQALRSFVVYWGDEVIEVDRAKVKGTLRGSYDDNRIAADFRVTWKGRTLGPIGLDPPTAASGTILFTMVGSEDE
ncbi:MAG: hypothetical protein HMLKMBBP_03636 [Planctomycetes bacterium]|nr:hypothetical protein [Planctomycetota bacterium]